MNWTLRQIGRVRSVWQDAFGVPRQPRLVAAWATVELDPAVLRPEALRGLETFSHVWLVFGFDRAETERQAVRPPRHAARRARALPGAVRPPTRMGVLATRSPHRPNRLGLSAVRLRSVDPDGLKLEVEGVDLLDGTPVFDVKPYLPYADCIPEATAGWADGALPRQPVRFAPEVAARLADEPRLAALLVDTLALDPRRPGARTGTYASRIAGLDVHARVDADGAWTVERLVAAGPSPLPSPPKEEAHQEAAGDRDEPQLPGADPDEERGP